MVDSAQRIQQIPPYFFAALRSRISALEAEGHDIIRLDVGSPDMPPSPAIIEALYDSATQADTHGYQSYNGTPALREAWSEMYKRVFLVHLDPDTEIVNLLGSKEGIFHLLQATTNPGDVVLVPDPGYPTYFRGAIMAGGKPYSFPLEPSQGFTPDLSLIPAEVLEHAKTIWLNYPNNPTGATVDLDFFSQAVAFAHKNNLLLCHDAAYTQVSFNGYNAPSVLQVPGALEVAVEFNSLSKSHNMAGWRTGVAAGNPAAIKSMLAYKTNVDSGHFRPILEAATAALTSDQGWLDDRNKIYQQRRDIIVDGLKSVGVAVKNPLASLYIWCPVPEGWTSENFTSILLEEVYLSLTPGTVFGAKGEGYVRISLVAPTDIIQQAVERLVNWWRSK